MDSQSLDEPISLCELESALKCINKGKTPGPDGIPSEFLLHFWDILGQFLLNSINSAIKKGSFLKDNNTALISLIPKKGKDLSECANFRPISLIDCDIKLYSKVLALRLEKYMDKLIHPDQAGFIKGRFAADNMRRLFHILAESKDSDTPCAILLLDAEKAFDRLKHQYLWRVLE